MASEVGHVGGDRVRMLVPELGREQGRGGPGMPAAHGVRQHRPDDARHRAHPRSRRCRSAGTGADQNEALDPMRHPDGELERDPGAHRQPDDVHAGDAAIVEPAGGVGSEHRHRDRRAVVNVQPRLHTLRPRTETTIIGRELVDRLRRAGYQGIAAPAAPRLLRGAAGSRRAGCRRCHSRFARRLGSRPCRALRRFGGRFQSR